MIFDARWFPVRYIHSFLLFSNSKARTTLHKKHIKLHLDKTKNKDILSIYIITTQYRLCNKKTVQEYIAIEDIYFSFKSVFCLGLLQWCFRWQNTAQSNQPTSGPAPHHHGRFGNH